MTGQFIITGNKVNGYTLYLHLPNEFLRNFNYSDGAVVGDSYPFCETWGTRQMDENNRETGIRFAVLASDINLEWIHEKLQEAIVDLKNIVKDLQTTYYYEQEVSLE